MNNENKSKRELLAKAFHTEYSIGTNCIKNWQAKKIDDDIYQVKRHDGSTTDLRLGQELPNIGMVSINDEGNLAVGKYAVLIGENIVANWTAKPTRSKTEFFVTNPEGKKYKIKIEDTINGIGVVQGLDGYGNLLTGGSSIAMEKKVKELKLLVYKTKHEKFKNGYECHFNLILPGEKSNMKNGTLGVFFPANGKLPARFCEIVNDDKLLSTASFWPSKDKSFSVAKIRTLDDAINERAIYEKIKEVEKECRELQINPEDNFDYTVLSEELKQANDKGDSYRFTVGTGGGLFGLEQQRYAQEYN